MVTEAKTKQASAEMQLKEAKMKVRKLIIYEYFVMSLDDHTDIH